MSTTSYKRLSDAVSELTTLDNVSTSDYFLIFNRSDGKAKKQTASELHVPYKLNDFNDYASFSEFLDTFSNLSYKNGKYRINVGGVPSYITFEVRSSANKVYGQWVEGPAEPNKDGTSLYLSGNKLAVHICSRIYKDGKWSTWEEVSYKTDVPTLQKNADGTLKNYIYSKSASNETEKSFVVLNGKFRMYQYGGNVKLQHQGWGSTAAINNDKYVYTINCDTNAMANSQCPGFMSKNAFNFLNNFTLTTPSTTTESITISYPNINSTTYRKELKIDKATSAKAGLMTTEQYGIVENIKNGIIIYKSLNSEEDALQNLNDINICNNEKIFIIQSTFKDGINNSSYVCLQNLNGKYCNQTLFIRNLIKRRIIEFESITRASVSNYGTWETTTSLSTQSLNSDVKDVVFTEDDKAKLSELYENYLTTKESEK